VRGHVHNKSALLIRAAEKLARKTSRKARRWLRPIAALLGATAAAGGMVALYTIDNSAGSLFLLSLGTVLLLFAFLGDRVQVESFELLGAKVKVRDVIRSRLELADQTAGGNQDARTAVLRAQALTLQKLAGLYEYIRRTRPASDERTGWLEQLATRTREVGKDVDFEPAEVARWFHEGSDALRVIALNLMLSRNEYRDFSVVLSALEDRRSLFEQYYALKLGLEMITEGGGLELGRLERELLEYSIKSAQRRRSFRDDRDSMYLANRILSELGAASGLQPRT
jgi:hypothetical protein